MKYLIVGIFLLSFIIVALSSDDAYAKHPGIKPIVSFDEPLNIASDMVNLTCDSKTKLEIKTVHWYIYSNHSIKHPDFLSLYFQPVANPSLQHSFDMSTLTAGDYKASCDVVVSNKSHGFIGEWTTFTVLSFDPDVLPEGHEVMVVLSPDNKKENSTNSFNEKKNGGKDRCSDCTPPTIGLDTHGKRFVDYGVVLNGEKFQMNNYKTHIPMMYAEIGVENHLSIKVYENKGAYNIDFIQFGMVKEIGSSMNVFEPRLHIDVKNTANDIYNPALESIELIDKKGIISNYTVKESLVDCMDGYTNTCLQLDIYWSFEQVPENKVLAIGGWDNENNSFTHYLNDGMTVTDSNYVEPITKEPYQYECKDPPLDTIQVWTRLNCNFAEYKQNIADEALQYLEEVKYVRSVMLNDQSR